MIFTLDKKFHRNIISSSECAHKIFKSVWRRLDAFDREKEHLFVMGLNRNNTVKYFDIVSVGNLTSAIVHPREVFRRAIHLGADTIVICHNHPSGNTEPSKNDILITQQIKEAGKIINIELLDHLIITADGYFSFADSGRF